MLKEAQYPCWGYRGHSIAELKNEMAGCPEFNKVAYMVYGNHCYYAGIERHSWVTSTINAADSIIQAIATQEGVPVTTLRYYDLQTYAGGWPVYPGEYLLDEVKFEMCPGQRKESTVTEGEIEGAAYVLATPSQEDLVVTKFIRVPVCPVEVLEAFQEYIGQRYDLEKQFRYYGRFCEDRLAVMDHDRNVYHLRPDWTPAYEQRYLDTTDFCPGGFAAVKVDEYKWAKIDRDGNVLTDWMSFEEVWKLMIQTT